MVQGADGNPAKPALKMPVVCGLLMLRMPEQKKLRLGVGSNEQSSQTTTHEPAFASPRLRSDKRHEPDEGSCTTRSRGAVRGHWLLSF